MRKLYLLILLIIPLALSAQEYGRSVGVRGGVRSGIVYKQFVEVDRAIMGILSFKKDGIQLTAIREYYDPTVLNISDRFYFSMGYGGHIGFLYTDEYRLIYRDFHYAENKFTPVIGLDAYFGIEYEIKHIPIVVGVDYKPYFEFAVPRFFSLHLGDFAFNIKYMF